MIVNISGQSRFQPS